MNVDFIGVGAARCSTTWLYECLKEHPDICIPEKKELHFFDNDKLYQKGIESYEKNFDNCRKKEKVGEITPRYMLYEDAMIRIKQYYPNIKIIINLRDPVERALSQYKYFRFNKKKEPNKKILRAFEKDFKEDYVEKSLYFKQIKLIVELFGMKNIKIIYDFDIKNNPRNTILNIFDFLGVDSSFVPKKLNEKVNYSQRGYYDPNFLWAKLNKYQKQTIRKVNGVTYGMDECPNWLKPMIRNIFSKKIFNIVNLILDKKFSNKLNITIDKKVKKNIYNQYFQQDIVDLEK